MTMDDEDLEDLIGLSDEQLTAKLAEIAEEDGATIDDPRMAGFVDVVARNFQARCQFATAEQFARRAIAIREATATDEPTRYDLAVSRLSLATALVSQARFAEARPVSEAALAEIEALAGADSLDAILVASQLADICYFLGDLEVAEVNARRVVIGQDRLGDARARAIARLVLGTILVLRHQTVEAEALLREALPAFESPPDRDYLPPCLAQIGLAHLGRADLVAAESMLRASIAAFAAADRADPVSAAPRTGLVRLLLLTGQVAEAEQRAREVVAIAAALGPDSILATNANLMLASVLVKRGREHEAKQIAEAMLRSASGQGVMGIVTARSMILLAQLSITDGDLARAATLARDAVAMFERLGSKAPEEQPNALATLAMICMLRGDRQQADEVIARARREIEAALGSDSALAAEVLQTQIAIDLGLGRYDDARALAKTALDQLERATGPTSPGVSAGLQVLAEAYRAHGAFASALPLARRALEIARERAGDDDAEVATLRNLLAALHYEIGDDREAKRYSEQAVAYWRSKQNPWELARSLSAYSLIELELAHDDAAEASAREALALVEHAGNADHVGSVTNNLAIILAETGRVVEALELLRQSRAIAERVSGRDSYAHAMSLLNVASLQRRLGARDEADRDAIEAIAIIERTFDAFHPTLMPLLRTRAALADARGAAGEALALYERAAELEERYLAATLRWGSDERKLAAIAHLRDATERAVSFHLRSLPDDDRALAHAATTVLRRKGRVLDTGIDELAAIHGRVTDLARALLDKLARRRSELAARVFAAIPGAEAIAALRREIDELESALSETCAMYRKQVAALDLASVQAAIPDGAALVELVCYRNYDVAVASPRQRWSPPRYAAYWFTAARRGVVDLGAADAIERAVERARRDIAEERPADSLRALDELVMRPLRPALAGTTQLFVSPDEGLHLVPFEALVDEHGAFLAASMTVTYVTGGGDLIDARDRLPARAAPLVIAAPAYGAGARFAPLEGMLAEGRDLARRYRDARLLPPADATKAALASATAPRILHIATHGFFTAAVARAPSTRSRRARDFDGDDLAPIRRVTGNALDLSGLAFAGANVSADAIMSARELSSVDLWGTDLVVLSACETGLGDLTLGEGVVGLRRALELAGAEAHVVSLWKVDDDATRELMRLFYDALDAGEGRAAALRTAKLAMIATKAHPRLWAAFIASGDWRPMPTTSR